MSNRADKPFRLCGCVSVDTEAEARAIQEFLREILGAGGFTIEHVETREDGATIRKVVQA